ncbi:hypothetical protein C7431_104188 [Pantoea allii]|uniref:Fimbrial protein n=1 Tax=Pantoea allii TaxID=574096 RepID=A0A2V2BKF0_9GAMM|nr:hypothetical protein [Pantoea allii]MDJ0034569.1 hypothetical protein [Pantoea allii]MDJ0087765.1 hypothetical protein [Pantoea allii]NQS86816.1 hypothetical protein [Pantoea allii]PWK97511.1 hypothetical protein C7431_104188 [Pantoea allii]
MIKRYNLGFILTVMLFLLLGISTCSQAKVKGIPLPKSCTKGSVHMTDGLLGFGDCHPTSEGLESGFLIGDGWSMPTGTSHVTELDGYKVYPQYSGNYNAVMFFCQSTTAVKCTISTANYQIHTRTVNQLNTTKTISKTKPNFGGAANALENQPSASFCVALQNTNGTDDAYYVDPKEPYSCSDGVPLPVEAATCYINRGKDIQVHFGDIKRTDLTDSPEAPAAIYKEINIPITCTRDAGISLKMAILFTSLVGQYHTISTTATGVNIIPFYDGHFSQDSDNNQGESTVYQYGIHEKNVRFYLFRDPDVKVKDIPLGPFSASSVMILTED